MKYQQVDNLEASWKWRYLYNKHLSGEQITRYAAPTNADEFTNIFISLEYKPELISSWVSQHMNPSLVDKLKQSVRSARKRHFDSKMKHTKKKSIDLEYAAWEKLSKKADLLGLTLSDAVEHLASK